MHKKLFLTIFLLFAPIAFLDQTNSNSQISCKSKNNIGLFLTDTAGYKPINELLNCSEKQTLLIKDCWQEGDLASQKKYCNSIETDF